MEITATEGVIFEEVTEITEINKTEVRTTLKPVHLPNKEGTSFVSHQPVAVIDHEERVINVISGGLASGGDTDRKRRRYIFNTDRVECFKA